MRGVLCGLRDGFLVREATDLHDQPARAHVDEQAGVGQQAELRGQLADLRLAQHIEWDEPDARESRAGLGLGEGDAVDLRIRVVEGDDDGFAASERLGDRSRQPGFQRRRNRGVIDDGLDLDGRRLRSGLGLRRRRGA